MKQKQQQSNDVGSATDNGHGSTERRVAAAYRRYHKAKSKRYRKVSDDKWLLKPLSRETEQPVWQAAGEILDAYSNARNWTPGGAPIEHLPSELAFDIATALEELLSGRLPETFKKLARRGYPGVNRRERSDIEAAVLYFNAAAAGLVDDPNPVATIINPKKGFAITPKTFSEWRRKAAKPATDPKLFWPIEDEVTSAEIEQAKIDRAKMIVALMRKSAKSYRRFGRSIGARAARSPISGR